MPLAGAAKSFNLGRLFGQRLGNRGVTAPVALGWPRSKLRLLHDLVLDVRARSRVQLRTRID